MGVCFGNIVLSLGLGLPSLQVKELVIPFPTKSFCGLLGTLLLYRTSHTILLLSYYIIVIIIIISIIITIIIVFINITSHCNVIDDSPTCKLHALRSNNFLPFLLGDYSVLNPMWPLKEPQNLLPVYNYYYYYHCHHYY